MRTNILAATILAAGLILLAMATPSRAVTALTLSGPLDGIGPQSKSNPCVVAGTQCQQPAGFGFNNFTQGGVDHIDAFSSSLFQTLADNVEGSAYTVGQIFNALGTSSFMVNLDVNRSGPNATDTLNLFRVRIDGVLQYEFNGGLAGVNVASNILNNGNGFADWQLGPISLAGYSLDTPVLFFAAMTRLTDGAESFFLSPVAGTEVPLPAGFLLFGSALGIGSVGTWWRKRRRKPAELPTSAWAA